ncbi:MAG TPA: hypothetical protein VHZ32_16795, partial [Rhizomicrobium sp.]|nr:hypothetical protein [Rhizomicrobium sp.]
PYKMGWAVSTDTGARPTLDSGHWPANGSAAIQRFTAYMLALALLETPDYTVTATGDFDALHAPANYSKALTADVMGAIGAPQFQQGAGVDAATAKVLTQNLTVAVLPLYLETAAAQNYSLQTATWAGAKLQQGMWYQMTAPLLLPGMGLGQYFLVTHNIAFSYARAVPCTPQDTAASCAEIVIHATPDPADFTKAHVQMSSLYHMPNFDALHYWSSINMRVVLKPDSLTPVVSDVRRSWYIAIDGVADPLISSERVVTTTTDH